MILQLSSNTQSIEYGMSGMSLLDKNQSHVRKATSSTVSTSPPEDMHQYYSENSVRSGQESIHSHHSFTQRPNVPSPIGKPISSKSNSASSPSLTMTPNSSSDGDWSSRQGVYMEPPALPFLQQHHHQQPRRASEDYRLGELGTDNDGLLGLGIRERAYSSSPRMYDRGSRPPLYTEVESWSSQSGFQGHDAVSHKFGSLPTLGAHLQQQRVPDALPKPRHSRSLSQPGFQTQQQQMVNFGGSSSVPRHSYSVGGSLKETSSFLPRSSSLTSSMLSSSYDSRVRYPYPASEYNGGSGGLSPVQPFYPAGHTRQSSDSGVGLRAHDDEYGHTLMGEHIEVPEEHYFLGGKTAAVSKSVYCVKFKRTQRNFCLGPRLGQRDLKIGTYVKVEADRGEDLGIVYGKVTSGVHAADLKRIIRLATHDEVSLLAMKRDEEEELLQICRTKVIQRGLPMHVVDAEYQFDRHKLTFFFEAEGRVDFRDLVRELFSMYKTRIWMQQLDKATTQVVASPDSLNMSPDYGTPIIAPEFAQQSSSLP